MICWSSTVSDLLRTGLKSLRVRGTLCSVECYYHMGPCGVLEHMEVQWLIGIPMQVLTVQIVHTPLPDISEVKTIWCDTILVVLELTLAISISPTSIRWWPSPFYRWSNKMGLRFSKFWGVLGLHTNWHKTKIQNIGTGDALRTVHNDNQAVETVSCLLYTSPSPRD